MIELKKELWKNIRTLGYDYVGEKHADIRTCNLGGAADGFGAVSVLTTFIARD